ncbi:glycosyltransferase [Cephaloticoccus primus]|uniref:glycosyltransferase n=1 Tax=Cephaloticoccus primus TaxID=1548207 RepID=UPI0009EDA6D3
MPIRVSVIIPTYNPCAKRLRQVLAALQAQTLPTNQWETIIVNNASTQFPNSVFFQESVPDNLWVIEEPKPGLALARACGLRAARGEIAIFVDDDNLLASDYLKQAINLIDIHPNIGIAGGRIGPEFESPPPHWSTDFLQLLACWDHGEEPLLSSPKAQDDTGNLIWPYFAPVGAGMVLRRAAWEAWLTFLDSTDDTLSDRKGNQLSSGGDNEIVLIALKAGWQVGYFPSLRLTHLIPESRLDPHYLARLNYGCSFGFIQALRRHDACPWPPISRWTLPLRLARTWLRCRAWQGPANYIRWRGLVGHFAARTR